MTYFFIFLTSWHEFCAVLAKLANAAAVPPRQTVPSARLRRALRTVAVASKMFGTPGGVCQHASRCQHASMCQHILSPLPGYAGPAGPGLPVGAS